MFTESFSYNNSPLTPALKGAVSLRYVPLIDSLVPLRTERKRRRAAALPPRCQTVNGLGQIADTWTNPSQSANIRNLSTNFVSCVSAAR